MPSPPDTLDTAPLSQAAEALYQQILDHDGEYELTAPTLDDDPACKELFDCGLIGLTDPNALESGDRYFTAVDPVLARPRWLTHLRQRALKQFSSLETVSASLDVLVPTFDTGAPASAGPQGGFEAVEGRREINARIGQLMAAATREVFTLQPGERPSDLIHNVTPRDRDAARRLNWRTLYEELVRQDPSVMEYVTELSSAGAEFRTAQRLIGRLIIIDCKTAVVPVSAPNLVAAFITEPNAVNFLRQVFMTIWRGGRPLTSSRSSVADLPAIQQEIVALLREGFDQAQIMRRTGLKARTCSAQIAELKNVFGASTLFQLGVAIARTEP